MNDLERLKRQWSRFVADQAAKGIEYEQQDLAKDLDVSAGFISHLLTGKNEPSLAKTIELAQIFGCKVEDLSSRWGAELKANASGLKLADATAYKEVALIGQDVVDFFKTISKGKKVKIDEFMHWPHPHSENTYGVEVRTTGMEPRIKAGAIVIVDQDVPETIGKVSAVIKDDEFILAEAQGGGLFKLENKDFPDPIFKLTKDDLFIGTVIGMQSNQV